MNKLFSSLFPGGKRDVIRFIKNTLLVVVGTAILAFGTGLFIIPFDLVTGGVSGLGIVLEHLTGFLPA